MSVPTVLSKYASFAGELDELEELLNRADLSPGLILQEDFLSRWINLNVYRGTLLRQSITEKVPQLV